MNTAIQLDGQKGVLLVKILSSLLGSDRWKELWGLLLLEKSISSQCLTFCLSLPCGLEVASPGQVWVPCGGHVRVANS